MARETIQDLRAREILDSRGDPTLEVTVLIDDGLTGVASVPSGASTGVHEAFELRDDDKQRYDGKGVLRAIENVNTTLKQHLRGASVTDQRRVDTMMIDLDGTANKRKLGANAIIGVSLAVARAGAAATGLPVYRYLRQAFQLPEAAYVMPVPMMNILNGGAHADNNLDVQEFMIVPQVEHKGKLDVQESVRVGSEVFHALGAVLRKHKLDTDVGNEGGYAPELASTVEALDYIMAGIKEAGFTAGKEVSLALDVAASEFYQRGKYQFEGEGLAAHELEAKYKVWMKRYPLLALEDGLAQDDWQGWASLTVNLGGKHLLVGDDLFVTSAERLKLGFEFKAANAIIIKSNQVGTLSETMDTVRLAQTHQYTPIVKHRSGETMDSFIADLAVAVGSPYLMAGAPSRGERVAKYNRLMEIAAELERGG